MIRKKLPMTLFILLFVLLTPPVDNVITVNFRMT